MWEVGIVERLRAKTSNTFKNRENTIFVLQCEQNKEESMLEIFAISHSIFSLIKIIINLISLISREFTVFWNIPSFMCQQFKIPAVNVSEKYGIVQNENDAFR